MKHLMVDLATSLVYSCSIYVSLDFFGVCGSSAGLRGGDLVINMCCDMKTCAHEHP